MTRSEYETAFSLLLDNKYDYVSGKVPVPLNVGRLLAAFYLWPYECEICDTEGLQKTHKSRLEAINSHEPPEAT